MAVFKIILIIIARKNMEQIRTARNENSWRHSLFYDANIFPNIQDWFSMCNPSVYVNEHSNKSIVVLHPKFNMSDYKKTNHRDGFSVPDEVKSEINLNRNEMTHEQLLINTVKSDIFQGFWFFSCENKAYWDYYFKKIVEDLYNYASNQTNNSLFVKIEARWNSSHKVGIIMVSNCNFSDVDGIIKSGERIEALINPLDVNQGRVSRWLSYKPQFYFDSGFDVHFTHGSKANIYCKDLSLDQGSPFRYSEGVKVWLDKNVNSLCKAQ